MRMREVTIRKCLWMRYVDASKFDSCSPSPMHTERVAGEPKHIKDGGEQRRAFTRTLQFS